jgi:Ca2+/Na+ antiporter
VSKHYRRLSLAQGASLCTVGVLVGLALLIAAPRIRLFSVDLLFILGAWFCFWFFSHDLAHHVVGRIVGVGFRYYFLGRSSITRLNLPIVSNLLRVVPVLGLKIDKSSLKSVSPNKVRAMYASGAIFSMFLPWVVIPSGFSVGLPVGIMLTILTIVNVAFTLYFSPRVGDLHHARMVRS